MNEKYIYLFADLLLALICISSIWKAWKQGLWRMLVQVLFFIASFLIAYAAAGWLTARFDLYALLISGLDVFSVFDPQACTWVLWFVLSYFAGRLLFSAILKATPYGRVKGILSFANHFCGLCIGVILTSINILFLCTLLSTNLFGLTAGYLDQSWLMPAKEMIEQSAAYINTQVKQYESGKSV